LVSLNTGHFIAGGGGCRIIDLAIIALLILLPPLAGVYLNGGDVLNYLTFPVIPEIIEIADFNWVFFLVMLAVVIAAVVPFFAMGLRTKAVVIPSRNTQRLPWWGKVSLLILVVSWVLAWSRFTWFAPLQIHTFAPLWFSLIFTVNAFTLSRTSRCMLTHDRKYTCTLFMISAVFWWYFEYLNGFVHNWYYQIESTGISVVEHLGRAQYAFFATIAFSTVLPGVLSIRDLLMSFTGFSEKFNNQPPFQLKHKRVLGYTFILGATLSLFSISHYPALLYPLVWLTPSFALVGTQLIRDRKTILDDIANGDYRDIVLFALSALVCGIFWEMWNGSSDAKWIYQVSYASRFHIFEMPLIGYAGYLPFGIECLIIAQMARK